MANQNPEPEPKHKKAIVASVPQRFRRGMRAVTGPAVAKEALHTWVKVNSTVKTQGSEQIQAERSPFNHGLSIPTKVANLGGIPVGNHQYAEDFLRNKQYKGDDAKEAVKKLTEQTIANYTNLPTSLPADAKPDYRGSYVTNDPDPFGRLGGRKKRTAKKRQRLSKQVTKSKKKIKKCSKHHKNKKPKKTIRVRIPKKQR